MIDRKLGRGLDFLIGDGRESPDEEIRQVEIEDLLGRKAVQLDTQAVGNFLADRRVLITGAGGSIGSEMCRQVCLFKPARLILVEQAENVLFDITNELRRSFPDVQVVPVVCEECGYTHFFSATRSGLFKADVSWPRLPSP